MGINRLIDTNIWTHHGVADLTPIAKLVYLYLYINPQSDKCGCVRVSQRLACFTLRISDDEWDAAIRELKHIVREFDGLYAIRSWITHNCNNPSWEAGAKATLKTHASPIQDWITGRVPPASPQGTPRVPPASPQGTPRVPPASPQPVLEVVVEEEVEVETEVVI